MTHDELMSMGINDLLDLYYRTFKGFFFMWWSDNPESHREEIVKHIETGVPQEQPVVAPFKFEEGVVY